eukprot:6176703-Pleurochrysis_carterae.AAC.1
MARRGRTCVWSPTCTHDASSEACTRVSISQSKACPSLDRTSARSFSQICLERGQKYARSALTRAFFLLLRNA